MGQFLFLAIHELPYNIIYSFNAFVGTGVPDCPRSVYSLFLYNLNAFVTTNTELKLIAAAAIMGLKVMPRMG